MTLSAGTRVGQYQLIGLLGEGGMGVVYRATDVQLKRPVAIKVLSAAAVGDPDRRRRFVQEAQAASALNHPDIITIYQIGREGATDFIAMEFVDGRSLDDRLRGRPLPLTDAVKFAIRIAGALAAAHRAGIVHRDLKPANVMITANGGVKLLDFGVAKLTELSALETATGAYAPTQSGLIVGTLAYMSPEQSRGEAVDARSDIYAFGVLLHEMITGKRPPSAGTGAVDALENVPRDLKRIVARCLQPEADRRFQSIDDARLSLEEADLSPATAAAAPGSRWPRGTVLALGVVALSAIAVAAWTAWRSAAIPAAARPMVLTRLTMDSGLTIEPVLSPDGRFIAFASDRSGDGNLDIWVRQVAGGEPVRVTSDPADDREPTFSPDGSQIAFRSDRDGGGVYVSSTLGGDARRIADACRRPRWSPAGGQIACWAGLNTAFLISTADAPRIFVISPTSGEPRRLFASFAVAAAPIWSADGSHLLFTGVKNEGERSQWWVASADGGSPVASGALKAIAEADLLPGVDRIYTPEAWTSDGSVLFSAGTGDTMNIWSIGVAPDGRVSAPLQRRTAGTAVEVTPTVDRAGALAFAAMSDDIDLWMRRLDAAGAGAGEPQRVTADPATDTFPSFSPDGGWLTFASNRSGTFDVWVRNLTSGKDTVVAPRVRYPSLPTFTKDGRRITYAGDTRLRWVSSPLPGAPVMRSTAPQPVCNGCDSFWDVSADGKWAIYGLDDDSAIAVQEIATGRSTELFRTPGEHAGRLRISPDDRWVAFTARAQGSVRVAVVPFQTTPIRRDQWSVLTPEDTLVGAPAWSATGDALYYLSNRDGRFCVWRQPIDRSSGRPAGDATAVWHLHDPRVSMGRLPLPMRGLGISADRVVISVAEGAGNIWMAK